MNKEGRATIFLVYIDVTNVRGQKIPVQHQQQQKTNKE
jgi:hypothetical protein